MSFSVTFNYSIEIQRKESSEPTRQDSNNQVIYENEQSVNVNNFQLDCTHCKRFFKTNKELPIHLHACRKKRHDGPNGQENKTFENDPANVITEIHGAIKIHVKTYPAS